jgi:c-di-GMP-binding flagellar brake protein YcgR
MHIALKEAIARNSAAVVALPSAGMVRHYPTRFLAESADGFWIESVASEAPLVETLLAAHSPVGIAFKNGQKSVTFTTPIRAREPQYRINESTTVDALCLAFPAQLRQQQRRQAYRVALPEDGEINLRLWRIPEHAILRDRPSGTLEVAARLSDLSVAGLRATCRPGRDGEAPKLVSGERLRILLTDGEEEILMEGRAVHVRTLAGNQVVTGVQFKKLDKDLEGRQTLSKLTKLVGQLQREELKRSGKVA